MKAGFSVMRLDHRHTDVSVIKAMQPWRESLSSATRGATKRFLLITPDPHFLPSVPPYGFRSTSVNETLRDNTEIILIITFKSENMTAGY